MMDDLRVMKRIAMLPDSAAPHDADSTSNQKAQLLAKASIRSLSLIETLYLLREGRVYVIFDEEDEANDQQSADKKLLNIGAKTHGMKAFAARFTAYTLLRKRGWVVRDGLKFGCDYVLYKTGGPRKFHAEYAVQ
ncbi:UNVERIFIED_CONTAM: hypothetical protein HDU68_006215, partial [Siphonaria sp. JEL0065]